MYYLLLFLGLIAVAVFLAMSPLAIRLLEYLFGTGESGGPPPAKTANPQHIERSEMRDEIRRLTAALEADSRGVPKG
jgi:hypothetical protein